MKFVEFDLLSRSIDYWKVFRRKPTATIDETKWLIGKKKQKSIYMILISIESSTGMYQWSNRTFQLLTGREDMTDIDIPKQKKNQIKQIRSIRLPNCF